MITLRDYQDVQGFGLSSAEDVESLGKALSAGHDNPPTTGGGALRVESLENTLKVVTYQQNHIRFWKDIPKLPAYSTVEEYVRLNAYGNNTGGFFPSGGLPEAEDTKYSRETELVKFLGTQREVTHPLSLVRTNVGDVVAKETANGTMFILNRLEKALFDGDSDIIPLEFNGIDKQFTDGGTTVIDLRGNPMTESDVEQGSNIIAENFGVGTQLHINVRNLSDLSKSFYPKERYNMPAPQNGQVGLGITGFSSNNGPIAFRPNIFLQAGGLAPTAATAPKAPATPASAVGAAAADATSLLDPATYVYTVTAVNEFGESAGVTSAGVAILAGERVDLTITDGAGPNATTGYRVYRRLSTEAVGSERFVKAIARTAASDIFADINAFLPGTTNAYMIQGNMENLSFKQLAPMMKLPLATISAATRWLMLLYGTPICYTPTKNVIYRNIGSIDQSIAPTGF